MAASLAITNMTGVPLAGYGVAYDSLSDVQMMHFLKVRTRLLP